jgi:hypothetical protein
MSVQEYKIGIARFDRFSRQSPTNPVSIKLGCPYRLKNVWYVAITD